MELLKLNEDYDTRTSAVKTYIKALLSCVPAFH